MKDTLFQLPDHVKPIQGPKHVNPLINVYGVGPEDKRCKACSHFYIKRFAKRYYKCDLRADTNGPGTDHRANWPTCGKFSLATEESDQNRAHRALNEGGGQL